jgi:MerR family transcriptional regulator, light-induced transcriptional regulator
MTMNQPSNLETASDEPLYNIGIVSRMTGIPVATLRVWERRYGFPNSMRTPGGHRLVSEKEVIRLRWVKARVDEGMQTGQAIRALQHLEQQGRFPETFTVTTENRTVKNGDSSPTLATFHRRLTDLLVVNNLGAATQLLGEVLALYKLEDLILEVVSPTMHDIGMAWIAGEISIATEHLATNFLRQHLLMWMNTGPVPYSNAQPIILACAPDELHEGSLMILGVLLRRRRWPVAYLGQNVPLKDLAQLARQIKAPAIVLVAMMEAGARALLDWPEVLPEGQEIGRPLVCYGGQAFNENATLREQMPGTFLGDTLRGGIDRLDGMLQSLVLPR